MLLVKLAALVAMGAILCSRQSAPPRRSYDDKVADLVASGAAQGFASIKKTTTGNRFEYHRVKGADAPSGARVDLSGFDGVIGVDADAPGGPVAHVEGLATMETVVAFLEPLGYRLAIVPELKHITVGGAISGVGIESGSFRHGWFHGRGAPRSSTTRRSATAARSARSGPCPSSSNCWTRRRCSPGTRPRPRRGETGRARPRRAAPPRPSLVGDGGGARRRLVRDA